MTGNSEMLSKMIYSQKPDTQENDITGMEVTRKQANAEEIAFRHQPLEERTEAFGGSLGPYTEFDWGEPEGREVLR